MAGDVGCISNKGIAKSHLRFILHYPSRQSIIGFHMSIIELHDEVLFLEPDFGNKYAMYVLATVYVIRSAKPNNDW